MNFSSKSKIVAGVLGLAMVLSLAVGFSTNVANAAALTAAQVQSIIGLLQSFGADQATINNVQASLTGGTPSTPSTPASGSYYFGTDLKLGMRGADVTALQNVVGISPATGYFGPLTLAKVKTYQSNNGISPVSGYVGPVTRAKLNGSGGAVVIPGGTTPVTPAIGTGLSVSSAVQPTASLAPQSAARVPFTKVNLTAGTDGDITVNNITVERTGLGADAVFSGIVLLDENGIQIGDAKTLNSNHQAFVGSAFTIKAGQTRTLTIAGNMASSLASYAGQVVSLSVVGVNAGSATVSGTLPITGAVQTINATLSLGSVSYAISSYDPNTSANKEIGTTGYKFAGIRVTAGSAEKLKLFSIRWNQSGSVSSSDLANIKTYVDGVAYDVAVSSDNKYYTTLFPGGLLIDKGLSKDIWVSADIVGSNASGRTIKFDIYKTTDLYLVGDTYGYGITPAVGSGSAADATSEFTASNPWFDGSKVTVTAGSATTISKSNVVPAQNIAVNVPNQVLGGFETNFKGEPVSVQQMVFTVATSGPTSYSPNSLLTSVSLYDETGAVVAGPVDATQTAAQVAATGQTITFTDTVTFPVGRKVYTLKGKIPSSAPNNQTIIVSTTPSTGWTNVTGQTTGNTVSLSSFSGAVTMNTMTVKSGSLAITVSGNPASQTMVAGGSARLFTNFQFDASQSGEDVRFSTFPIVESGTGTVTKITGCQLYDGNTALNSTAVNPAAGSNTFSFDNTLVITKGTVKTLSLKCNVASDATGTYLFGLAASPSMTVTGVTSGNTIDHTATLSNGPTMLVGNASLAFSADASSPSYKLSVANTTGNVMGVLNVHAANEAITLNKIWLGLTNTASSSPSDLTEVSIWDGSTKLTTISFTGASTTAPSAAFAYTVPKDSDKTLTIKADFAQIGNGQPITKSGRFIVLDYLSAEATGADSGVTVYGSGTAAFSGTRLFKSVPTIAKVSVPTNTLDNGTKSLLRFKVSADAAGPVSISKFTLRIATTTASVTGVNIYAYTDSGFSTPVSGLSSAGQMMATDLLATGNVVWKTSATNLAVYAQTSAAASTTVQVPAGGTRYFEVLGTVAGAASGASVSTQLQGDPSFPNNSPAVDNGDMHQASRVDGIVANGNDGVRDFFIWSPNSTSTSASVNDADWTNGYGVVGLPGTNMSAEVLSK